MSGCRFCSVLLDVLALHAKSAAVELTGRCRVTDATHMAELRPIEEKCEAKHAEVAASYTLYGHQ